MLHRLATLVLALITMSGCATTSGYGKVPHSELLQGTACTTTSSNGPAGGRESDTLFLVTTRLPDCRGTAISLTSFRSPVVLYGQFDQDEQVPVKAAKGPVQPRIGFNAENGWWSALEARAAASGGRVLVYVHGYRETFASNTRDTRQIKRMTGFSGPVVQYSWPSQGKLTGYLVDETNVYWDERNFRRFLVKLATQPWTKEIVLVSHSMGARLILPAVEFVDRSSSNADSSNISNIILASPDIDREDFERDIAEEILSARRVNNDRRIDRKSVV